MKTKSIFIIESLTILAIICFFAGFIFSCNSFCENLTAISFGIFTSALVVIFIEWISLNRDKSKFGYLQGEWCRVIITNKLDQRKDDTMYEDMTERYKNNKINPLIVLNHLGEGRYEGVANYEEGKIKFVITLDSINPSVGNGMYQYSEKTMPDIGTWKLQVDIVNNSRLYIYYSNIMPSGIASGYEIWERNMGKKIIL